MSGLYVCALWVLAVACLLFYVFTRERLGGSLDPAFRRFQYSYLSVFALAVGI